MQARLANREPLLHGCSRRPHSCGLMGVVRPLLQDRGTGRVRLPAAAAGSSDPFFTTSPFELMTRDMDAMTRQMDAEMGRMMGFARRVEAQAAREVEEALDRAQRMEPGIQIRTSEERSINSYRYYQSISISSMPRYQTVAPVHALGPSPWLLLVAVLVGAYTAVAAAFARNIHLTSFKDEKGWQMGAMWPILLATSSKFREQFWQAIRGRKSDASGQPSPQPSPDSPAGSSGAKQ